MSRNRERLFGSGAAEALLGEVVRISESRRLLSSDRLVVDGTQIKAWASHKSLKAKDGNDDDKPNFKGTEKVGWELSLDCIAFNLGRMANYA